MAKNSPIVNFERLINLQNHISDDSYHKLTRVRPSSCIKDTTKERALSIFLKWFALVDSIKSDSYDTPEYDDLMHMVRKCQRDLYAFAQPFLLAASFARKRNYPMSLESSTVEVASRAQVIITNHLFTGPKRLYPRKAGVNASTSVDDLEQKVLDLKFTQILVEYQKDSKMCCLCEKPIYSGEIKTQDFALFTCHHSMCVKCAFTTSHIHKNRYVNLTYVTDF